MSEIIDADETIEGQIQDIIDDVDNDSIDSEIEEADGEVNPLPYNFTRDPQHPEHMDLNIFSDQQIDKMINVYQPVSDDAGEILGNIDLEEKVIDITERLKTADLSKADSVKLLTEESLLIIKSYDNQIALASTVTKGSITKYRIREGMLCNAVKPVVKANKENWTDWVEDNFTPKRLRTLQDCMGLALIPNIIRYSFLDLERLKEVKRAIKGYDSNCSDPIADFFQENDITLDFDSDEAMEKFKLDIDTAVAVNKIKKALKKEDLTAEVKRDLVRNTVGVTKFNKKKIDHIVSTVKREEDLDALLRDLHQTKGRIAKTVTEESTIEGFPRIVSELKSTVNFIQTHTNILESISLEHITELENQVAALKELLNPGNNK